MRHDLYPELCGLGEFCCRAAPATQPFRFAQPIPLLATAYDSLGPARMLRGGDYQLVSARERYANAPLFAWEQHTSCGPWDPDLFFGGTARRLYRSGD